MIKPPERPRNLPVLLLSPSLPFPARPKFSHPLQCSRIVLSLTYQNNNYNPLAPRWLARHMSLTQTQLSLTLLISSALEIRWVHSLRYLFFSTNTKRVRCLQDATPGKQSLLIQACPRTLYLITQYSSTLLACHSCRLHRLYSP